MPIRILVTTSVGRCCPRQLLLADIFASYAREAHALRTLFDSWVKSNLVIDLVRLLLFLATPIDTNHLLANWIHLKLFLPSFIFNSKAVVFGPYGLRLHCAKPASHPTIKHTQDSG